jgi:hypothetical protein
VAAENARIWIEPDLPPVFHSRADRLIALLCESHGTADIAPSPDHQVAALRLTTSPSKSAEAVRLAGEPLALVTSPRLPVRSLTVDQANAVLSGQITDWSEFGAPTPVKVEIVQRPAGPDPAAWGPGLTVASYDDLVSLFPSRRDECGRRVRGRFPGEQLDDRRC